MTTTTEATTTSPAATTGTTTNPAPTDAPTETPQPHYDAQAAAAVAARPPRPIARDITDTVGETPLIELGNYAKTHGLGARLLGKAEFFNPAGSVKDRTAWSIIRAGEESGALQPGGLIVDVTSGNTGIALAAIGAGRGYRTKFYLGENTSPDKRRVLEALGSEIIPITNEIFLDPEAKEALFAQVQEDNPEAFLSDQLANPVNPEIHYATTGPEIWRDTEGSVDILVAGVGTGGTSAGAGRYLKDRNPDVQIIIAEPGENSLPTEEQLNPDEIDGVHKVAEVEPELLPANYDPTIVSEVIAVEAAEAYQAARALLRADGLLVGQSAGAAVAVATRLALRPENAGKTIVAILPDTGERYLSAGVF